MDLRPRSNKTVPPAVSSGMAPEVFYITGAGGRLTNGLGQALINLKIPYAGMEISKYISSRDRLKKLSSLMSEFIKRGGCKVIAVSAGAFLFLKYIATHHSPDLQVTFFLLSWLQQKNLFLMQACSVV
jgi:hypothetical protein